MKLYLSSRHTTSLLTAAALVAASPSMNHLIVAFPRVIGEGQGTVIPLSALSPLVLALFVARGLTSRQTHLSGNAARATGWLDAGLLLTVELVVVAVTSAVSWSDWTVPRNVLILAGLTAIGACLVSPAASAMLVTIFVLFVVTYGTSAPGARFVRVLQAPPETTWALAVAIWVTVAAAAALTRSQPLRPFTAT